MSVCVNLNYWISLSGCSYGVGLELDNIKLIWGKFKYDLSNDSVLIFERLSESRLIYRVIHELIHCRCFFSLRRDL